MSKVTLWAVNGGQIGSAEFNETKKQYAIIGGRRSVFSYMSVIPKPIPSDLGCGTLFVGLSKDEALSKARASATDELQAAQKKLDAIGRLT